MNSDLALEIHCNASVILGANKLLSEDWTKRDHRGLQRIDRIWYSFCILGKSFIDLLKVSKFLSFDPDFSMMKSFVFDFKQRKMIEFEEKCLKVISSF